MSSFSGVSNFANAGGVHPFQVPQESDNVQPDSRPRQGSIHAILREREVAKAAAGCQFKPIQSISLPFHERTYSLSEFPQRQENNDFDDRDLETMVMGGGSLKSNERMRVPRQMTPSFFVESVNPANQHDGTSPTEQLTSSSSLQSSPIPHDGTSPTELFISSLQSSPRPSPIPDGASLSENKSKIAANNGNNPIDTTNGCCTIC